MQEIIDFVVNHWDEVALVLTSLYAVAHQVAKWTPNTTDDEVMGKIQSLFDVWNGKKKF